MVNSKLFRVFVLVAWLPFLGTISPTPPAKQILVQEIAQQVDKNVLEQAQEILEKEGHEGRSTLSTESNSWVSWFYNLVMISVGIIAGFLAVMKWRSWKLITLLVAAIYLTLYVLNTLSHLDLVPATLLYFKSDIGLINVVQGKIRLVEMMYSAAPSFSAWLLSAYAELAMPLLQVFVIVAILRSLKRARAQIPS